MVKKLALLSGKGGSGKTTLALSIASLLSNCKIKVLLVDCDLSTNGATYFYEDKLLYKNEQIISFDKILSNNLSVRATTIEINDYLDFIPSITQITKESIQTYIYKEKSELVFYSFLKNIEKNYDVILFDCQAGYTDTLKVFLPYVDINLIVMEADAISSASLRSLYLKIGEIIKEKKVFQIFNKVTKEEYDIYSKLSGGTVFTNIETVIFDWKIRKAFSIAQIPDMESTSAYYGKQIHNICKILFLGKHIQERLEKYNLIFKINENNEQKTLVEKHVNEIRNKQGYQKNRRTRLLYEISVPLLTGLTVATFFTLLKNRAFAYFENYFSLIILLITTSIGLLVAWMSILERTKEQRDIEKELQRNIERLEKIENETKTLEENLRTINSKE